MCQLLSLKLWKMPLNTDYPQIILVMHEPLGQAFEACVQHIYGDTNQLTVIDIGVTDLVDPHVEHIYQLITQTQQTSLLLCDLIGATPFNIAQAAFRRARQEGAEVELITGANLGMVLKAIGDRHTDPRVFANAVREGALRGVMMIDERP